MSETSRVSVRRRPRRRRAWALLGCVVSLACHSGPARAADAKLASPEKVDAAIKKAVAYLYAAQNDKGHWETFDTISPEWKKEPAKPEGGQFGGLSSMAVYSMLDAGESWKDPRIRKGIEWLYKQPMMGTYAVSFRSQIWQYLPQTPGVKSAAQRDCNLLLSGMKAKGDARGFWSYFVNDGNNTRYDHSCSQIALLGIWGCQQAGRDVPVAFWKEAEQAWLRHQLEEGAWSYVYQGTDQHGTPKMTMTLAGIATLFICQDYVHVMDGLKCTGNQLDPRIQVAVQWVEKNWAMAGAGGAYGNYAFERVAMASGYKYFGEHDWYKIGAQALIARQQPNGSWGTINDTAFSLLFLTRGRQPVIVNKFEYELEGAAPRPTAVRPTTPTRVVTPPPPPPPRPGVKPRTPTAPVMKSPMVVKPPDERPIDPANPVYVGNWAQRPRDVASFTRWMSYALERKLNWQIVSNRSPVDDYHDAPVLYIAGNQKLDKLPKDTADRLKQYVEDGGLIFANADCGSAEFTDTFKALGKQLFPQYEFRELPADHPLYTLQQFKRTGWKSPPPLLSMSNGTRELMMISPANDLARFWQMNAYKGNEPAYELMSSVVLYASDRRNLKFKGATHIVRADKDVPDNERKFKVARLKWNGNWDPEPGGWRRIAAVLHNKKDVDITPEPVDLGQGTLDAATHPVAHLTGTGPITLSKEQLAELRKYALKGGVILADAAGGNSEMSEALQRDLVQIFAGSKLEPIGADDPILKGTGGERDPMYAPVYVKANVFDDPNKAMGGLSGPTTTPATPARPPLPTVGPDGKIIPPPPTGGAADDAPPAVPPVVARKDDDPDTDDPTPAPPPPSATAIRTLLPAIDSAAATEAPAPPDPAHIGGAVAIGDFPVEYRKFAKARLGVAPGLRLKGIKFRGKWAVIFSAEDLSTGVVGQQVDGIVGYTPATATEIMRRLITNAGPKVTPPTAPGAAPATP